ncbi:MAG: hypothetical protein Q8S21_06820 [Candidatus Paracaedibacteraceae bacterium]|nr:hypothetical protein [Candidatus Paracaedibacteraceae bacterium]
MIKKIRFLLAFFWIPTYVLAQNLYEQNKHNMCQPMYPIVCSKQIRYAFGYENQGAVYPVQQSAVYQQAAIHSMPHGDFYQDQASRYVMQPSPATPQIFVHPSPTPYVYSSPVVLHRDFVSCIANSQLVNLNEMFRIDSNKNYVDQAFVNVLLETLFMKKKGISLILPTLNYLRKANLPLPNYDGWNGIITRIAKLTQSDRHLYLSCADYLSDEEKRHLWRNLKRMKDELEKRELKKKPLKANVPLRKNTVAPVKNCVFEQKTILDQDKLEKDGSKNDLDDLLKMAHPYHPDYFKIPSYFKTFDSYLFEEPNNL